MFVASSSGSGGDVVQRKKIRTDGSTDDGHRPITIANIEPSAQMS